MWVLLNAAASKGDELNSADVKNQNGVSVSGPRYDTHPESSLVCGMLQELFRIPGVQ